MTHLDPLRLTLEETVQDMSHALPEPNQWGDCLLYLLEVLDGQAQGAGRREEFDSMLVQLQGELQNRLDRRSWWASVVPETH